MKLCITEKPSVARDIANILAGPQAPRRDGFIDCGEYIVTWTFGHLCCLKEPHDYTPAWRTWTLAALPMIPPRFGIKLIDSESYRHQFAVIESLIRRADEIINCGDAGQEGELIQRWVMQKAGARCPVSRLWISSLTDEAIRQGFASLRPQAQFDPLYHAGLARAIGDWLLGMNATRLYSLRYARPRQVLSIGRVQTPTLALVVERCREIDNFVPSDFWELRTVARGATFNATSGRFTTEAQALQALEAVRNQPLVIDSVERKKGTEAPPRLFDLTSLQVEANKRWGWTADLTLRLIQTLYEKKVTTYPRVDTTYLPDDLYPRVPDILRRMTPYADITAPILAKKLPKSKKVFDNARVTDHHAIIPTGQPPTTLQGDERRLYHLIALRFIAAFYPDCRFSATTVNAHITPAPETSAPATVPASRGVASGTPASETSAPAPIPFRATGKVIDSPGWRILFPPKSETSAPAPVPASRGVASGTPAPESALLPPFAKGETLPHTPSIVKKTTQPPKYYTDATLLRAMETAGRTVDDPDLRDAMKENGIGRPSTRAAIIETLFKRGYIHRQRKNIIALPAGTALIDTITDPLLKSAKLTGIWENKLRRIERGDYPPGAFLDELKQMVTSLTHTVLSSR